MYLPAAREHLYLPPPEFDALLLEAWRLQDLAVAPVPAPALATAAATTAAATVAPAAAPVGPSRGAWPAPRPAVPATTPAAGWTQPRTTTAPAPTPSRFSRWWDRLTDAVGSDLAAHGLAYIGVLLLFVGVFGLVAFAFGDVSEGVRPVAELGIVRAPFAASWMLLRRGAEIAGRALELAGGLLLPVMLATSMLDGVAVPPDPSGTTLVVALTAEAALTSLGYWWWSRRHHDSALRFLVAPVAWLAVGFAVTGAGREIPAGRDVASITAWQVAAMSAAVVVTLAWARWRPSAALSGPSITSSRVGAVVLALLALLTWVSEGWPTGPVLVAGTALLLVLELLRGHVPRLVVGVGAPLWWAVTSMALVIALGSDAGGIALAATVSAAGFLVLLDLVAVLGATWLELTLPAVGLVVALSLSGVSAGWALVATAVVAGWAHVRRVIGWIRTRVPQPVRDLAAVMFSVWALVEVAAVTTDGPLTLLIGTVAVVGALLPIRVPVVRRAVSASSGDGFWLYWWDAGTVAASAAALLVATVGRPATSTGEWLLVASAALLTVGVVIGPIPASWRVWPSSTLGALTWLTLVAALGLGDLTRDTVLLAASALGVVAAHLRPALVGRWSSASAVAGAGYVVALLALGLTQSEVLGAVALGVLLAEWLLTLVLAEVRSSPFVDDAVRLAGGAAHYLAPSLVGLLVPVTAFAALDAAQVATVPWLVGVLPVVSVAYAACAWLPASAALRRTLAWSALLAAVLGEAGLVLQTEDLGRALGLAALVAGVLVLPRALRSVVHVWTAWVAVPPALVLGTRAASTGFAGLDTVLQLAASAVVIGGAMLVLAYGTGALLDRWTPMLVPARHWLWPPAALGGVQLALGTLLALGLDAEPAARLLLASGLVVALRAALSRAWALLGVAVLVLGAAAWVAWEWLATAPWVWLGVAVALLGCAEAAARVVADRHWWARADVAMFSAAHLAALIALGTVAGGTQAGEVLVATGVLALAVAARLRARTAALAVYGTLGTVAVVGGAGLVGPGWLALALAVLALALGVLATRPRAQVVRGELTAASAAAALGAWASLLVWLELAPGTAVDVTVGAAAVALVVVTALLRLGVGTRQDALVRGGAALAALVLAPAVPALVGATSELALLSWWTVASLAVAACCLAVAATVIGSAVLRYGTAALLGLALAEGVVVAGATPAQQVIALAVVTAVASVGVLVRDARLAPWRPVLVTAGGASAAAGVLVAFAALPDSALFATAWLVAAAYLLVTGTALHAVVLQAFAPVTACVAWLSWAAGALDGNPQWFAVPSALALFASLGLVRRDRRSRGLPASNAAMVLMETIGVVVLVGPSFVQTFTDSIAYAVLAAGLGVAVVVWGVLTQVRRRLLGGSAVVLLALLLLVAVPLARLLPAWSGAMLWVALACVGLVAILAATLLEKGRAVVRRGLGQLHELTSEWE
ncbi:MAG: hypothetical protein GC157_10075 [Frankiales bacterium]|nr:hypothetical protein [Frankiales bacterium]